MSSENGSSKADTLVKVVLVFFISLLSFSVGTFVGKQVSDSDHRRLALEGEYKADRQVASADGKAEGEMAEKNNEKISDKEVEHLTEEFVNKEKAAGGEEASAKEEASNDSGEKEKADAGGYKTYSRNKTADNSEAAPAESTAPEKTKPSKDHKKGKGKPAHDKMAAGEGDATSEVAEKVADGKAPSDGAAEERKPAATLPSVASSAVGKYTVQVGSYAEESEAKNHAADLKSKGWNSFYFPAAVQGHTWYRVSVGLFTNVKSANDFRAQFMKDANTKSAIVQKVIQ